MTPVVISIHGYGDYTVTPEFAAAIAAVAEHAQAATALINPSLPLMLPLYLEDCGNRKIAVIKEVRQLKGMTLKEAKRFCDEVSGGYPPVRTGVRKHLGTFSYEEAQRVAAAFQDAGATVNLPSPLELLAHVAE